MAGKERQQPEFMRRVEAYFKQHTIPALEENTRHRIHRPFRNKRVPLKPTI